METLTKLYWLLFAAPVVFILVNSIYKHRWFRLLIIFLNALLLTYFTIFLFNKPLWRWSEQKELIKVIGQSHNKEAYEFVKNNFLLIDNSFDKTLLPNPEGDVEDSTSVVITNRKSLISFFRLLNEHVSTIDFVVFDIGLHIKTEDDSVLANELIKLYAQNKILFSIDPYNKDNVNLVANQNVYGSISEIGNEKLFTSHAIKRDEYYSLPYKIYCLLNKKTSEKLFFFENLFWEKDSNDHRSLALNTFFPEFMMTDETLLKGFVHNRVNTQMTDIDSGYEKKDRIYYFLSQPLSSYGQIEFIQNLEHRKKAGQKNIIFIGSFASSDEDVHQTLYGNLHGATILLNIFYSIQQKKHYLSLWVIFLLFIGYLIISLVLVYHSLKINFWGSKKKEKDRNENSAKNFKENRKINHKRKWDEFFRYIAAMFSFLFFLFLSEGLVVFSLIFFVLFISKYTGQLPNLLPLVVYIVVVKVSLDSARERILKKR